MRCHGYIHYAVMYRLRITPLYPRKAVGIERIAGPLRPLEGKEGQHLLRQRRRVIRVVPAAFGLLYIIRCLGIAYYHGLAVHVIPGAFVFARLIEFPVYLVYRLYRHGMCVKRHLGRVQPRLLHLLYNRAYFEIHRFIGPRICGVKHNKINACVRKQLHLAAYHPLVRLIVISEQRLSPKMKLPGRAYAAVFTEQYVHTVFFQYLRCIIGVVHLPVRIMIALPQPEEHSHLLFARSRLNIKGAPELIYTHKQL